MSEISVHNYFDKESANWHEKIRPGDRERLYQIFFNKVKGIKKPVLDAGCGTGILLPVLSKLNLNIFPLYEVDLSHHMLMKNREYHHNKLPADYIQADVGDLPFKTDFFHTIISFASFPHFNPKDRALEEFWRVLSPDGILVILHLMGSENLNMMHERVGGTVKGDRLPPIIQLSSELMIKNFNILHKEDSDDMYLLIAKK
jgi:demethylmenaquinone methyltransferase/2-methoxy-6-polyprenyl-1,4-benzoquinol methylase